MKIALVSSEVVPFAKTGGLADVAGALGKYLSLDGIDVRVFTPLYNISEVDLQDLHPVEFMQEIPLQFGDNEVLYSVLTTRLPDSEADVYFIEAPELFGRGTIYTDDEDEYLRFALLSRATLECCQRMAWGPDILHCNDWQSALIPLYLRTVYAWDSLFAETKTILTIHNLAYQGAFSADVAGRLGFVEEDRRLMHQDDLHHGVFNYLKHGIIYADAITTVSETYAKEIQTPEFGEGLDRLLRDRAGALFGIVNGVDYQEWSPENDPLIPHPYTAEEMEGKEENRKALMERMGLPYDREVPIIGIVSRLVAQKGFDLFPNVIDVFLRHVDFRFCILGSGAEQYEEYFTDLAERYPERVAFHRGYSNELAHLIEAGSDIFLMPSRYEPCGLNQIYSLKYGTLPIVRRTGGLADTVRHADPVTREGNGFVFDDFNPQGLAWGIETAIETFRDREWWEELVQNAMGANWSWERQIDRYLELYQEVQRWEG